MHYIENYGWPNERTTQTQRERAADIIANCRSFADDATFASKHGMSVTGVRKIRLGVRWGQLRKELEGANG